MIEVTYEMVDAAMRYFNNPENAKQNDRDWIAGVIKIIIELHEANKPKPEPVGYIYNSRLEQMLNSEVDNDCNFFPIKDDISRVIFNRNRDKYLALYTTPPTREPLSDYELKEILNDLNEGDGTIYDFARAIEQAHGIGVTND